MDPLSVFRTVWRRKWLALPVIVLTLIGCGYVLLWGPRLYESTASYVLITPKVPTEVELERDPALAALNSDNPYLRSSDPTLASQVVIAKLSSEATADALKIQGLDGEFTVVSGGTSGSQIIDITGSAATPTGSLALTAAIGAELDKDLHTIQTVNGADESYLLTPQRIEASSTATERVSSRLRSLIVVAVAGFVALFGVVSLGQALESSRSRRPRGGHALGSAPVAAAELGIVHTQKMRSATPIDVAAHRGEIAEGGLPPSSVPPTRRAGIRRPPMSQLTPTEQRRVRRAE